tara:strand:+ start:507 stop:917 length:411 start_codon:yes stop_codon:yes gene_type:complete
MIEFIGKKSRKHERIVRYLSENGEQSTHDIVKLFETGKLCATTNEIANLLKKSGLFTISGQTNVSKFTSLRNSYSICKWDLNYEGLVRKYEVKEFGNSNKGKYIFNTTNKELYHLPTLKREGLWESIEKELEKEKR